MLQNKEILNSREVAELLGISYKHVLVLVAKGELPALSLGERPYRFSRQAILDYLYFGSLSSMADKFQRNTGIEFEIMMEWIMRFRNYKEKSELQLVQVSQEALKELKKRFIEGGRPDIKVIDKLEEALEGVKVFTPTAD